MNPLYQNDGLQVSYRSLGCCRCRLPAFAASAACSLQAQLLTYRSPPCAQSLYPCPKCEKGYMKVRHHLCPCDQEKVNATGVVKVRYGTGTSTSTTAAAPAAAAAPDADTSRSR